MICTWEGCTDRGYHLRLDRQGLRCWATLCEAHNNMFQAAVDEGNVKKILSYYVKAVGGSKKAAERM